MDKLKEHYKPTKNSTLAHYEFHILKQLPLEYFDTFVNRVKHERLSLVKSQTLGSLQLLVPQWTSAMTQMLMVSIILVNTPRKRRPMTEWHPLLLLLPMPNASPAPLVTFGWARAAYRRKCFACGGNDHFRAAKACQSQSPLNAPLPPTTFMIVMILLLSPVHLRNQRAILQQRN